MGQINRGEDKQKIVLRVRIHKPDFAMLGKMLLLAPKKWLNKLLGLRLRYRFIVAVFVLILAEAYSVLTPYLQDSAYAIGNGEGLLLESSHEMAAKIKFDQSQQTFNFNTANQQSNPEEVGASTLASAVAHKDPTKGVTVTDAKNKVTFTMIPKFGLDTGRQDRDRIVYPLSSGDGFAVYTMRGVGVKEDIILNSTTKNTASYSYTIQMDSKLTPKIEQDGSIGIYGNTLFSGDVSTGSEKDAELLEKARKNAPKDTLLFTIPKPVVNDVNGPANGITAKYSLDGDELTVTATGLQKGKYPISIDPSIYVATAQQFMAGNNETNINFDVDNKLIKKGRTTGARFDAWNTTTGLSQKTWGASTAAAGGYIYSVGGTSYSGQLYTSQGTSTYTVPAGVTSITVKMWGAGGGGGSGGSVAGTAGGAGGAGGYVNATVPVTPGETLNVYVGGAGGAGTRTTTGGGGGGGSFSGIARGAVPLAVAGGGAGGGGGRATSGHTGGAGGAGGGTTGITGSSAGGTSTLPTGGAGGTPSAGGAAGINGNNVGTAGGYLAAGLGGDGRTAAGADGSAANGGTPNGGAGGSAAVNTRAGGGGAGAGYYGGGGGSGSTATSGGSGGGGGSSYSDSGASAVTNTAGSGTTPGNSGDSDRNGAGTGGVAGAAIANGNAGSNGLVNITYGSGAVSTSSALSWAQFNTGTGTIDSPNPGQGACSGWCSTAAYNLPDGRANFSLVAYNGYLYAMGGASANCTAGNGTGTTGFCNTVYVSKLGANGEPQLWHPTDSNPTNAVYWYRDTNLPTDRAFSAAVAYNNRMYFTGGRNSSGVTSVTSIADITPNGKLGTWTTSATALPSNLYGHDIQVYNDRIYILGGSVSVGGTPSNSVYYSKINTDGTLNTWKQTTSFTTGRINQGGNMTVVWGGYMYLSGGCNTVNGSGYCTAISSDSQVASINADGSLDTWSGMSGLSDTRMSHSLVAWRDKIYEIGGCSAQTAATGDCNTGMLDTIKYGKINQDGDASTVSQSVNASTSPCNTATPTNCDLPGTTYIGNMLAASVITNGYLYVIGGCNDVPTGNCGTTSGNVAYVAISSTGKMVKPASCPTGTYRGNAWCVDTTNTVSGGIAASSPVVFGGKIYLVGGMTGTANKNAILRSTVNNNGSLSAWTSQQLSGSTNLNAQDVTYTYAFARANPSNATTYPGNLYILGGCTTSSGAGCSAYTDAVYKCNIKTDGSIDTGTTNGCSTTGQLQIGIVPGGTNAGLAIMSGAVYANYIYLVGGATQDLQDLNTTRYAKIDNSNNIVAASGSTWIQSTSLMNVGRRRAAAFGYNGYLYIVGGYDSTAGVLPDIEFIKLNVSDGSLVGDVSNSNKWYKSSVQINQRWGLSVPVSNSFAYVIGGCTTGASPSSCTVKTDAIQTFQLYNNASGVPSGFTTANTFATNPTRIGISSAVLNGKIYVAGGCTMSGTCTNAVNTVSYASLDAYGVLSSWADTTAALPADRAWGSLKAVGGSLYYMGGHSDTPSDARTEIYYSSPSSGDVTSWSTATNGLPNARAKFGATVWDNRLYVVGGEGSGTGCSGGVCNTVYVSPQLNTGGNITSAWSTSSTSFNVARSGTVAVAYANNLYIFGGYDGTNYLSDTQYSQLSTNNGTSGSWTYSASLPRPLAQGDGFAANGYMYILGGRSTDTSCNPIELIAPISANTTIASGNNPTGVGSWYEANERYAGPRYGNATSYYDGKAYVLGGLNCAPGATYTTAGANSYTVPSGVYNITVKAWGGGGGGGGGATGVTGGVGAGAGYVSSTIATTPGETLTISVGGGGGGGQRGGLGGGQGGGGGGGYSGVTRNSTPLLIAAGGGGGGGGFNSSGVSAGPGGAGGGTTGTTGTTSGGHNGGGGGTSSAGGAGGTFTGNGCAGYAGSSLTGGLGSYYAGACAPTTQANGGTNGGGAGGLFGNGGGGGGGGGAGYYGGGGGAGIGNAQPGAGGGGGSSYTTGSNVTNTAGSGTTPGNSGDSDRGTAGAAGAAGAADTVGDPGITGKVIIDEFSTVQQSTLLTQPQVAKYSIMIDTDSDVFPTHWLLNGIDNSIGARWQLKYRSMTNNAGTLCTTPAMTTWGQETAFGNVTLGLPGIYTPLNASGITTDCARYYNFNVSVDSSQAFGYPDDVTRGPTITDLTLNFKADPAKRLMHGRTFTGGLQMPIDTPYNAN